MSLKSGLLIIWLAVTFIPVSTVFADDSEDFVACQQIKPKGKFRPMKEKKNCFRDLARQRESELNEWRSNTDGTELQALEAPLMSRNTTSLKTAGSNQIEGEIENANLSRDESVSDNKNPPGCNKKNC
ncbi:MAG TPA: hypothetical protein EYN95_09820 [Methylococcaceae bacterium]|nr:hypothetical protein [Methylococcaceae bacterium]